VLHPKETFLQPDHSDREKFARLTAQEEKTGLLDETAAIGTRARWQARLAEKGYTLGRRVEQSFAAVRKELAHRRAALDGQLP